MYITYLLLAVTILVSVKAFNDEGFKQKLMLNPYDVVHHQKWYRCFTHAFIHADIMHLSFNMFALYIFGENIELSFIETYGNKGYLYFGSLYLGGILFSSIWSIGKNKDNPYYNSLGASGAVSAVIFAYILLYPMNKLGVFPIPPIIPAFIFGPLLLVFEYAMAKRGGTGIAHDAHISGAVYGIVFMTILDYHILLDFFKQFSL